MAYEFVVNDPRTATVRKKGEKIVADIYDVLLDAAMSASHLDNALFPRWFRQQIEQYPSTDESRESDVRRMVCDYIASMTDGQALSLHARLFDSSVNSQFDPV